MVGWNYGEGLDAVEKGRVSNFIEELKLGLNLFTGPLNFEDGSVYLEDGEIASDIDIWYTPQLLEGMK